jgi:hypothetical protein
MTLPSFIIGGAPRSGTTWLARALDNHPDVWMAKPLRPEPKFFLVDELYANGIEWYAKQWFADAPSGAVVGEKSTNYLESATSAARISSDLPDVKLVFVLREPVARAWSNYRWSVMNGMETEDLETALRLEPERERTVPDELRYARPHAYFSRGCYAALLSAYLERFDRAQIHCLRFEDLVAHPVATVSAVHRFLGVEPRRETIDQSVDTNAANLAEPLEPALAVRLEEAYSEHNAALATLLGPTFEVWEGTEVAT